MSELAMLLPQQEMQGLRPPKARQHLQPGKYGKHKSRDLLYCRTCGKRFAASQTSALFGLHLPAETIRQIIHHTAEGVGVRATARLLGLDKDTVNRVILRAGEHGARVLSSLLASLELKETQLDELWTFIRKPLLPLTPPCRFPWRPSRANHTMSQYG